jgi:hypothetical protein
VLVYILVAIEGFAIARTQSSQWLAAHGSSPQLATQQLAQLKPALAAS